MEIKSNLNFNSVVNYLNQGGSRPKESNVYSGLMELAVYTRLENTIVHHDVIDAMMRQPFSAKAKPFKKHDIGKNTVINAVDYDLGRNGIAYFDTDTADYHVSTKKFSPGNRGHTYRNDGVDIVKDATGYAQYYISHIAAGEWLQYTVNVLKKGTYTLKLKVAAAENGGKITVWHNGNVVSKEQTVPVTGGLQQFQFMGIKNVFLGEGKQILKILADIGGFNLSQLQLVKQ